MNIKFKHTASKLSSTLQYLADLTYKRNTVASQKARSFARSHWPQMSASSMQNLVLLKKQNRLPDFPRATRWKAPLIDGFAKDSRKCQGGAEMPIYNPKDSGTYFLIISFSFLHDIWADVIARDSSTLNYLSPSFKLKRIQTSAQKQIRCITLTLWNQLPIHQTWIVELRLLTVM